MTANDLHPAKNRLGFFDNLRAFVIMFVILQHVALIYGSYGVNTDFSRALNNFIVGYTDIFMLAILFFIAGFFALTSIRKKGAVHFFHGKIRRIWLPWLTGVIFIVPVATYCEHLMRSSSKGETAMGYADYWHMLMRSALNFYTGFVTSQNQFSHRHLWFLSTLFFYFVIFTAAYWFYTKFTDSGQPEQDEKPASDRSIFISLLLLGTSATLVFFILKLFFRWGYQSTQIAGLIHFDPSRLGMFAVYFAFGVYACRKQWFSGDRPFGNLVFWLPLGIITFCAHHYMTTMTSIEMTVWIKLILSFLRSFLCLSIFVVLITLAQKYWNGGSGLSGILSSNSFYVYIVHYPIHAVFAMLFFKLSTHYLITFAMIYIATFILSHLISEYAVKPHPRLSVAGLVAVNVAMFVLL